MRRSIAILCLAALCLALIAVPAAVWGLAPCGSGDGLLAPPAFRAIRHESVRSDVTRIEQVARVLFRGPPSSQPVSPAISGTDARRSHGEKTAAEEAKPVGQDLSLRDARGRGAGRRPDPA